MTDPALPGARLAPGAGPSGLRLGLAFHGDPFDPASWSGTPRGIGEALRAQGHEVVGLSARAGDRVDAGLQRVLAAPRMLPRLPAIHRGQAVSEAVDHAKSAARIGAEYRALGSLRMRRELAGAGHLDAVVRMGTSFEVRHPRVITFEDLTVRQAVDAGELEWARTGAATHRMRLRAQQRAFREAVACCTATPWAAASVVGDFGIAPQKVFPVGLGANHLPGASPVDAPPDDDAARPAPLPPPAPGDGRDWSVPRFLFVGKAWEDKNGPVLLAAFRELRERVPEATLDLVGNHPRVAEPGVTGHGFLRTSDPRQRALLASLYGRATCLVVPTTFEPAGIVHVEAAAAGVPSIGSARGGAGDMIGPAGLTVTPGDAPELVAAMERMSDPGTARRMGEAGRERARLFTWDLVAHRMLQAAGLEPHDDAAWQDLFPG
ncbi:glycosyltransferase family 4 protein [Kocuria sp.]|uniref:glycosyltransferase family 4 protein n=1 Tax=Kocuria sp. TaxID=1871328 RepID=UPI0026DA7AA7|nr:glycosyltransferase family 4 protein [Kocuria sp.]MDO4918417.1 glycosyltransferase family 4 protein [Kocuria sp.]